MLPNVLRHRQGAVSMIASLALPFLLGGTGLAVEFGNALLVKVSNQRVADAASYAGALAYARTPTLAAVEAASDRVAALNGIAASGATASFGLSPRGNGNTAVQVVVTTRTSYFMSRLLGAAATLDVPAASTAEITADAPGCIFALGASPATGVTLSGGTSVTAPSCGVASNNTVTVPCGTNLVSLNVSYNSAAAPTNGCNSIRGPNNAAPTLVKKAVADPLATAPGVTAAVSRLANVAAMTSPSAPGAPTGPAAPSPPAAMSGGVDIDFGYGGTSTTQSRATSIGCTATWVQPVWTLSCPNLPPPASRTFNNFSVQGGIQFRLNGAATNIYNFRSALQTGSGPAGFVFAAGTYNFASNLTLNGTASFGASTIRIGGNLDNRVNTDLGGSSVTVVGNLLNQSTLTLGTVAVGGNLTTSGGTLTIGGGALNVTGNIESGGNFTKGAGAVSVGGSLLATNGALNWADGALSVVGNLQTSGGGSSSFGTGAVHVGGSLINGSSGAFTIAGASSVQVRGGIANTGSATMTLPASSYSVGQGATSCNGGYYSICTTNGPIVFGGPSSYALTSGIYVTGGGRISFTGGTSNSYRLGRSSNGYGIAVGGGATLGFADAIGGLFEMNGPINYTTGGGSCLTLPAAAQHDINGNLDAAGGLILGAGTYTINGVAAFGRVAGGAVTCNGQSVSVKGTGVTLVLAGTPVDGSCGDLGSRAWSFCVTAGYSGVDLTAPADGAMAKLLVIGPQGSTNTTGATFGGGATNANLSGAFYYPRGPVLLGGGSGVGDKPGQCLTLIGTQVTLTGGAVAASACISGATGANKVVVIR